MSVAGGTAPRLPEPSRRRCGLAPLWLAPLLAPPLLIGGCLGYQIGYQTPPGVKTIAVPIFQNATFPLRREVEFQLTSLFRKEIQARTALRIVDESSSPDMVVRGKILEFRESVTVEGRIDQKVESNVVARVVLEVENYLDHTVRQLETLSVVEPFSIQAGESFETGQERAVRNLAERLVVSMEDWGPEPADGN